MVRSALRFQDDFSVVRLAAVFPVATAAPTSRTAGGRDRDDAPPRSDHRLAGRSAGSVAGGRRPTKPRRTAQAVILSSIGISEGSQGAICVGCGSPCRSCPHPSSKRLNTEIPRSGRRGRGPEA